MAAPRKSKGKKRAKPLRKRSSGRPSKRKSPKKKTGKPSLTKGLRRLKDKRGRTYYIDKQGRRATPGKRPKPRQPRDAYGRIMSRTKPRVSKLPPWRGPGGKFQAHPLKDAARALADKRISVSEWLALREPKSWPRGAIAGILEKVRGDEKPTPPPITERLPVVDEDDEGPEEPDIDGWPDLFEGETPVSDGAPEGLDLAAWEEMMDDLDLDERELWEIYDQETA